MFVVEVIRRIEARYRDGRRVEVGQDTLIRNETLSVLSEELRRGIDGLFFLWFNEWKYWMKLYTNKAFTSFLDPGLCNGFFPGGQEERAAVMNFLLQASRQVDVEG